MEYPIRVAQMMTDMNYGGVEMVVMNYYRHIDRTKVQFDFFALEGSSLPQREEIEQLGGRVYVVPKYTHLFQYEKEIQRIFQENNYQIVHSHMNTLSVFSLYAAKKAGVPNRILHNHSTAGKGETRKNIMKYMLRPFAKMFPTELCACSKFAGEWIYGKKTEFKVFNNGIDLAKYQFDQKRRQSIRRELGIENKKVIGHVGRFCYQKNQEFLIEIFRVLANERNDAVLLLIGEGETELAIREKVSTLGLQDRVYFLGKQTDTSIFYQAMDVFVLPSRYEGLGMVAIEAQACSLPTICSAEVPQEAQVLSSTTFLKLEDGPEAWADAIMLAESQCDRRDTCNELRSAGYDIKLEATKLTTFYEKLLGTERTQPVFPLDVNIRR